jgi:uncharacterized protein YndB with AHSA1/START domain
MADIRLQTAVAAVPAAVYACLTLPRLLARWLSDSARLHARVGGAYTLMWNDGRWAAGVYAAVEPDARIAFTWNEAGAPGETQVELTIAPADSGARVSLIQSGFGEGAAWSGYRERSAAARAEQLDDLKTLLETATDARFLRRPMIGAGLIPMSPDEATAKDIPAAHALGVTVVIDGGAAQQAGLRVGDAVTQLDGDPMAGFADLSALLARHRPGDVVPVEYYRSGRRHTALLTLAQRSTARYPESKEALYEAVDRQVAEIESELDSIFAGVPESALNIRPAPHEWSAKEVLAHLIWAERWFAMGEWLLVTAGTPIDWGYNNDFEIGGMVASRQTAVELLDDLKRILREQRESVRHIPDETLAVMPLFAELSGLLCGTGEHCREHYDQLRAAIAHAQAVIPA